MKKVKRILALSLALFCMMSSMIIIAHADPAGTSIYAPAGTQVSFTSTFAPQTIPEGYNIVKVDYTLTGTAGAFFWLRMAMIDAEANTDGSFYQDGCGWACPMLNGSLGSGTVTWTLSNPNFNASRAAEFYAEICYNQNMTVFFSNLRFSNGSDEIVLSANCDQATAPVKILQGHGIPMVPVNEDGNWVINKVITFSGAYANGFDASTYDSVVLDLYITGVSSLYTERPYYWSTALYFIDANTGLKLRENNSLGEDFLVAGNGGFQGQKNHGHVVVEIPLSEFDQGGADLTAVKAFLLYLKFNGGNKSIYQMEKIGFKKGEEVVYTYEAVSGNSIDVENTTATAAAFTATFDPIAIPAGYDKIRVDYCITPNDDATITPGYHNLWTGVADADGNVDFATYLIPGDQEYSSSPDGKVLNGTIEWTLSNASLNRQAICEFQAQIRINRAAKYTFSNLRIAKSGTDEIVLSAACDVKAGVSPVRYHGTGVGITSVLDGAYQYDTTFAFDAADASAATSLVFDLTVARAEDDALFFPYPGYFGITASLKDNTGKSVSYSSASMFGGDLAGTGTVEVALANFEGDDGFDYSAVTGMELSATANQQGVYYVNAIGFKASEVRTDVSDFRVADFFGSAAANEYVRFIGVQESTQTSGTIRFIGWVDGVSYSEIGFNISATYGEQNGSKEFGMSTVYSSIRADGNTVTPGDLGYAEGYLFAKTITGVPAEGTVTFRIQTFYKIGEEKVGGNTYQIVFRNGKYVSTILAA